MLRWCHLVVHLSTHLEEVNSASSKLISIASSSAWHRPAVDSFMRTINCFIARCLFALLGSGTFLRCPAAGAAFAHIEMVAYNSGLGDITVGLYAFPYVARQIDQC